MSDVRRRNFIKNIAGTTAAMAVGSNLFSAETVRHIEFLKRNSFTANDNINIALIGAGGMGTQDTITALTVLRVKLVAVCDLYDGRLKDAKTKWGTDIFTTRSYKEILNRKDIDAVIIGTLITGTNRYL